MITVLTGAGGYLGRLFAAALAADGHALILLDRAFPPGYRPPEGRHLVRTANLADAPSMRALSADLGARGIDHVVHAAAVTAPPRSIGITSLDYLEEHLAAGLTMLRWAERHAARAILVSSAAVFAPASPARSTRPGSPSLTDPTPSAKRMLELATVEAAADGVDGMVIRLGNLYGGDERPGAARPATSLVQQMIEAALRDRRLTVRRPSEVREWTYAPDVAALLPVVLRSPVPEDRILHLSSGEPRSRLAVARAIAERLPGTTIDVERDEAGPIRGVLVSSRVRPEAGWTPFEEGLEATLRRTAASLSP